MVLGSNFVGLLPSINLSLKLVLFSLGCVPFDLEGIDGLILFIVRNTLIVKSFYCCLYRSDILLGQLTLAVDLNNLVGKDIVLEVGRVNAVAVKTITRSKLDFD